MNDVEANVMSKYLELKDFDAVDKEMGFQSGWSKIIVNKIKSCCFGSDKNDTIQKIS